MFRRLKLRLTIMNVLIMGMLLALFITATYFIMSVEMYRSAEQTMQGIAADVAAGEPPDKAMENLDPGKNFYLKTSESGVITEVSPGARLNREQFNRMVQRDSKHLRNRGEFEWGDQTYTFLRTPLQGGEGYLWVFVDVQHEKVILLLLLAALAAVGLISLVLAFFGGLFLAERAMVPIKNSWLRQKEFVADASHELRTPLAVIQTNIELVRGNSQETVESQDEWLDNIQFEAGQMARLVEDLLFLARADSEQVMLERREFPLHTTLREAIKPLTTLAESKGVGLEADLDSPLMFSGDPNRIKQLVVILLDNAIKNTPAGGQIKLGMQLAGSSVKITVSDDGEGIEPQHLERIFERFYRVDPARSKETGGAGLGLSIADWIVHSHQGTIKVESTPGQGTTFIINLPVKSV